MTAMKRTHQRKQVLQGTCQIDLLSLPPPQADVLTYSKHNKRLHLYTSISLYYIKIVYRVILQLPGRHPTTCSTQNEKIPILSMHFSFHCFYTFRLCNFAYALPSMFCLKHTKNNKEVHTLILKSLCNDNAIFWKLCNTASWCVIHWKTSQNCSLD